MTSESSRFNFMSKKVWAFCILLLAAGAIVWSEFGSLSQVKPKSQLELMGDECAGIADNAVANMVAVVEFQKLEIQGRKVRVMRLCMADKGFQENPRWLAYANPMAKQHSVRDGVSLDEALENLKRTDMMKFRETNHPLYWQPRP